MPSGNKTTRCIASVHLSRKCEPRKEVSPPSELFLLNISLGIHSFDTYHHNNTILSCASNFFLFNQHTHNQHGRSTITFLLPASLSLFWATSTANDSSTNMVSPSSVSQAHLLTSKAKKIARLRFHHNSYFNIRHFQPLLTSHLRYLRLDRLGVPCRDLDVNLWSEHIQSLCGLRGLRYCRLERLRYECDLGWDDVSDTSWLELPGQGGYVCDYDSFHLLFRDGTKSFEAKGESVCTELKGLVCYLEASEEQKRSQIIREGLFSHDRIGIVD